MGEGKTIPLDEVLQAASADRDLWPEAEPAVLRHALVEAWEAGRAAWPGVVLSAATFVERLTPLLRGDRDPTSELSGLRGEDLYLCFACLTGVEGAVAAFETHFMYQAREAVTRVRMADHYREEITQRLRARLLVGTSAKPPRIASYRGQGPLGRWIRVAATRLALNMVRDERQDRRCSDSLLMEMPQDANFRELEEIKRLHQPQLKEALTASFASLTASDRDLLREYVYGGLTVAALGVTLGVDASTVSRRLKRIRELLLENTRAYLTTDLGLRPSECDSVIRLAQSGLHVSVERLLEGALGDAAPSSEGG